MTLKKRGEKRRTEVSEADTYGMDVLKRITEKGKYFSF